jgi:hypothetical protein
LSAWSALAAIEHSRAGSMCHAETVKKGAKSKEGKYVVQRKLKEQNRPCYNDCGDKGSQ